MSMIDIHCHILPSIDDGPKAIEESLVMAEMAATDGIDITIATPHVETSNRTDISIQIADKVAELQSAIDSKGINLQIAVGAEVYPSSTILQAIDKGAKITLGDAYKYILLDLPLTAIPLGFEQLIFDLQSCGLTPILAHPERCHQLQKSPGLLEPLVQRGLLLQCNASSILGSPGSLTQSTMQTLLRQRWVHFIASDAHSIRHRKPILAAAAQALVEIIGQDEVDEITINNARRVLMGENVPSNPADYQNPEKHWLTRIFSRGKRAA